MTVPPDAPSSDAFATGSGPGEPPPVVLATRNRHKVAELRAILAPLLASVVVRAVDEVAPDLPEVPETGLTFAENALLKARAVARATGLPAVADDSGICVDVLGGAPGVFSARWCGRHGDDAENLRLLLAQLADVPAEHRAAHFACAAALVLPGGAERVTAGRLDGVLLTAPVGSAGFGYDPILRPVGQARSCAELAPVEKDAISHRGQAFRALAPHVVRLVARTAIRRPPGDEPVV